MSASESEVLAALNTSLAIEQLPFRAVLDGPGGILSDYPAKRLSRGAGGRVPLMLGTVLDEGLFLLHRRAICSFQLSDEPCGLCTAELSDRRYFDIAECKFNPVSAWP